MSDLGLFPNAVIQGGDVNCSLLVFAKALCRFGHRLGLRRTYDGEAAIDTKSFGQILSAVNESKRTASGS
jgi:hypothetical protein